MPKTLAKRRAAASGSAPFHLSRRLTRMPLRESITHRLRRVSRGLMRALEPKIAALGIPAGCWFALRVLWDEDELTQIELAERIGVMGPTTFAAIRRLERLGFVSQVKDSADRRKNRVRLTPAGRALEARTVPLSIDVINLAMQGLTQTDVEHLRRITDRMIENLEREANSGRQRAGR